MKGSWVTACIGDCVDVLDNRRVPVNSKERQERVGDIPYFGATGQVGWIDDFIFNEELVLVGGINFCQQLVQLLDDAMLFVAGWE